MSIKKLYDDLIKENLNFSKKLEELLKTGFDINTRDEDGMSLLNRVASDFRYNDEVEKEVIKHLIKNGADVNNARPRSNWTSLFNAIMPISVGKVQVLLENGADPNIPYSTGELPINRVKEKRFRDLYIKKK